MVEIPADKVRNPIKIGVIGTGLWGEAHARVFAESNYSLLSAVCDLDARKASDLAGKYGVPSFRDADAMMDAVELDAVSVATPDFAHTEPVLLAARRGKHILVEKPLATTLEDVTAIETAVQAAGVRIMVDFHARWSPPFYRAWESVRGNEIGEVVTAYYRLNDVIGVPTRLLRWSARSSILWFLGSHTVDTLRWILDDEVSEVYAVSRRGVLDAIGIDAVDAYQAILTFSRGCVAQIENNWIVPDTQPNVNDIKMNILGTRGMLDLDLTNNGAVKRFLPERYDEPDLFVKTAVQGKQSGFAYMAIADFAEKLWRDEPFGTDLTDGVRVTRTVLAIMDSAERGTVIRIEE